MYKANKSLMSRIFIVVFLYSLLIGVVGFALLGFVINFDTQSFSPQLYDINQPVTNSSIVTSKDPVCNVFNSIDCQWSLYDDLMNTQMSNKSQTLLTEFQSRLDQSNLNVLQEVDNNRTFLTNAIVNISSGSFTDPFTFDPSIGNTLSPQNISNEFCISVDTGGDCHSFVNNQPLFQFIPGLYEFSNSTKNLFLGSYVLLLNDSESGLPSILCSDYYANCDFQSNGPNTYTGGNYTDVPAYQSIILPNIQVSLTGNLILENPNAINIVCSIDSGSCDNLGINLISNKFLFLDSNNNVKQGQVSLNIFTINNNHPIDYNLIQNKLSCARSDLTNVNLYLNGTVPLSCSLGSTFINYNSVNNPLENLPESPAKTNPKIFFKIDNNNLYIMFGLLIPANQAHLQTFTILGNILSNPVFFIQSLRYNTTFIQILLVSLFFIIVNILLSYLLVITKLWKKFGNIIAPISTLFLRGRVGKILETTQFFHFGGSWYLEAQGVYDYNFNTTMDVVHQLVNERWRDTIFFPTALAATISIFFIT